MRFTDTGVVSLQSGPTMAFRKSTVSLACCLQPQNCQDERRLVPLTRIVPRMTMTREESELLQLANERARKAWRKAHPERESIS